MALLCIGCAQSHLSSALILFGEARKFERAGNHRLADRHLVRAIGELRQGEEQHPLEANRKQIRGIRKKVETAIASNRPIPAVEPEIEEKAVRALGQLRRNPELCPTCKIPKPEVEHV